MRQEKVDATSFHFAPLTHTYRTQCRYHGNRYRHQDDEDREADTSVALFQQETYHMFTHFEGQQPVGCNFFGLGGGGEGSVITDIPYCTHHHPTGSQEDDDTEDVDHTWREDSVPRAEQHRFRDKEIRLPPRAIARRLQTEQVSHGFIVQQLCRVKNFKRQYERDVP